MLSLVLLLAAVSSCSAAPSNGYSFSNTDGHVAQFYSGAQDAFVYNWGYNFPGRAHTESKGHDGVVQGAYVFNDANGDVQHVNYKAHPVDGFVATQVTFDGVPDNSLAGSAYKNLPFVQPPEPVQPYVQVSEPLQAFVQPPKPVFAQAVVQSPESASPQPIEYTQEQFRLMAQNAVALDVKSEQAINRASPEIMKAVRSGLLIPVTGFEDQIVFRVKESVVDDVKGSVSALASFFDVDTIAPRHDQQVPVRPQATFYSGAVPQQEEQAARGLLDIELFTDGPAYVLRIPKS